jgi:hypothetical protein
MTKMPEPAFIPYEGCRPYYTADQLEQAVRDALEEAAQFLYAEGETVGGQDLDPYRLARAIESLKEPTT